MKKLKPGVNVLIVSGFWVGHEGKIIDVLDNDIYPFRVEIEKNATNDYCQQELLVLL
ncbi:hypothetical protein [Viridibacillus arvi]|uniref:hypothetical protein n=1 Tax=Viridibacillus arvi TaxID=263475 RepID=UPI0034CE95F9